MSVFNALCRTSSGKQHPFVRCRAEWFACKHDSGMTRPNVSVGYRQARSQSSASLALTIAGRRLIPIPSLHCANARD